MNPRSHARTAWLRGWGVRNAPILRSRADPGAVLRQLVAAGVVISQRAMIRRTARDRTAHPDADSPFPTGWRGPRSVTGVSGANQR
jgi:hypothetical protein